MKSRLRWLSGSGLRDRFAWDRRNRVRRRQRVLVVDDCDAVRALIERIASILGLDCDAAKALPEARALLSTRDYDCLVVDIELNDHLGTPLIEDLATSGSALLDRLIVLSSGLPGNAPAEELERRGFPVILKPFDLQDFERKLRVALAS